MDARDGIPIGKGTRIGRIPLEAQKREKRWDMASYREKITICPATCGALIFGENKYTLLLIFLIFSEFCGGTVMMPTEKMYQTHGIGIPDMMCDLVNGQRCCEQEIFCLLQFFLDDKTAYRLSHMFFELSLQVDGAEI